MTELERSARCDFLKRDLDLIVKISWAPDWTPAPLAQVLVCIAMDANREDG
jgi:hypothetical protein